MHPLDDPRAAALRSEARAAFTNPARADECWLILGDLLDDLGAPVLAATARWLGTPSHLRPLPTGMLVTELYYGPIE
jgi:hypothetical protein